MVADLSDAFTLQPHLLCRLGERAVLSADAVESLHHLPAAGVELVDDLQQFGSGGLVFQSVVGLRGVFVGYDMSQAQLIASADGSVDRQRMAAFLLSYGVLGVARHTVESCLLLGCDNQRMSELAMTSTHVYPMAARCGVFAKTDVQNLMSRNLPESDIAASIFHSIAVQTVTTLSHGIDFTPPILLCGGPLTFLPALRKAFSDYLHLEASDFIVLREGNLIPALGCAIRAGKEAEAVDIDELLDRIAHPEACRHQQNCGCTAVADADELQPLFRSEAEYSAWLRDKQRYATPLYPMHSGREEVVIGIDSGSTTTKLIVVRADKNHQGEIIFSDYSMNLGNPIHAVEQALKRLKQKAEESGTTLDIVGSCSTGYGEELIKAAFNLDDGIIVFLQDVAIA